METEKDTKLWKLAKKRVDFKNHLVFYLAVNIMLWLIWYMIKTDDNDNDNFLWPAWSMLTWGVWLFFDFWDTYFPSGTDAIKKEYDKLTSK
jgi:hypothetical protein